MSQGNLRDWGTGWVPTQQVLAQHTADLLRRCCPPTGDQQPGRTGVTDVSDSQGNSGFMFVRHKLANMCLSTCLTEGRVAGTRQAILAWGDTPGPQSAGDNRGRLRPPRVSGGLAHG